VISIDVVETGGGVAAALPSTSVVLGFQFRGRVRASDDYLALPARPAFPQLSVPSA
jgi:hypothetical protein